MHVEIVTSTRTEQQEKRVDDKRKREETTYHRAYDQRRPHNRRQGRESEESNGPEGIFDRRRIYLLRRAEIQT